MRVRRAILRVVLAYPACSIVLAVVIAEIAFHPSRGPVADSAAAHAGVARFGAELQDASVRAADGIQLKA